MIDFNTNETSGRTVAPTVTLKQLEGAAQKLGAESDSLDTMLSNYNEALDRVNREHLRALRRQAALVATREAELHNLVESAPELFSKPRTLTIAGIKFGFAAGTGSVEIADPVETVKAIKDRFGRGYGLYVETKEIPKKDPLKKLAPEVLAELGCRVEGAGDKVVIKRVDGDIEKLLEKLKDKLVSAMVGE